MDRIRNLIAKAIIDMQDSIPPDMSAFESHTLIGDIVNEIVERVCG